MLSCVFTVCLHAQISGKLTDTAKSPIPLASVELFGAADSVALQTVLSDSAGTFYFRNIRPGTYRLAVQSLGFQTWRSPSFRLKNDGATTHLGSIALSPSSGSLDAVTVFRRKPPVAQVEGGLAINVAQSPTTPGSSVLQVLSRMPGVVVDIRGTGISLNGKPDVVIMLDGKLMRLPLTQVISLLNNMPADNLERIELLTNPPARYDAEGTAGIINIVTKKNKQPGVSGSLTAMSGYGKGLKASVSGDINYRHKGTDLHAYYEYDFNHGYSYLLARGTEVEPIIGSGETQFQYNGISHPKNQFHGAGVSLDQQISPSVRVGGSLDAYLTADPSNSHNYGEYDLPDSTLVFSSLLTGSSHSRYLHPNLYLEKNVGNDKTFRLEFDYLGLRTKRSVDVNSNFSDSIFSPVQHNLGNSQIDVFVGKMDISRPLGSRVRLETGLKGTATNNRSYSAIENQQNGEWVSVGAGTANDIASIETIGAAYLSLHWTADSVTDISVGGRYEYAHNGTLHSLNQEYAVDRTTSNLFPSFSIQRRTRKGMNWQLAYSQRIRRPSYSDLASYVSYNDPVSVFTGNPALLPTISSQVRLSLAFHGYLAALSYSEDKHSINGVQIMTGPTPGLVYLMPENGDWQKNALLEILAPVKIFSWWNLQANWTGGVHQYRISYFPQLLKKTYWSYTANLINTMKFSSRDVLEISGNYYSSSYSGNSENKGNILVDLGYQRKLAGNWGNLQLSVSNLLISMRYRGHIGGLVKDAFNTNVDVMYGGESYYFPVIKLSYTRRFGTSANQKRSSSGTGDEQQRL